MGTDDYKGIEFGLWHNGSVVSPLYVQATYVMPNTDFYVDLPSNRYGVERFKLRGIFMDELMPEWLSLRLMLMDDNNMAISTERPGLLYNGPSDCYTTVAFPSLVPRPLNHAGMWVVSMRIADSYARMRERSVPFQDAPVVQMAPREPLVSPADYAPDAGELDEERTA